MSNRTIPIEEWRSVIGFPGYEVSSHGRVRSYRPLNGAGRLAEAPRLLTLSKSKGKPYLRVGMSLNSKTIYRPVHQLVLEAFAGPRPPDMQALHNDGDAKNNAAPNLRWGTVQENADDRGDHGTQVRGEQVTISVLTEAQVAEVKQVIESGQWKHGVGRKFALKFGVSDGAISSIKRSRTWSHV